ncbi:MAG TPA: response regulator [Terriglobales bacterium]|nr:response regulator [Terriglobales bacterium]
MGPSPSVLIVDDSLGVSTAVAMMLEEEGFVVETAHNYDHGLQAAMEGHFKLLIIDVNLGPDSGVRLAEEILQRHLACKVILTSGLLDLSAEFDRHPELNNVPVLMKPFGRNGLLECVHQTLNEAAA